MIKEKGQDDTLLKFPCAFPIKVMGKAEEDFDALVVSLVRRHVEDLHEGAVKARASKGGRYVSVTVVVEAESKQQLDNIYMELTAHERIMMVL